MSEKEVNIIFLDIDGVLSSKGSVLRSTDKKCPIFKEDPYLQRNINSLCPTTVNCLNYILMNIEDPKIVVHSTWSRLYSIDVIKKVLNSLGVNPDYIIGTTPKKLSSEKCHEINWTLDEFSELFPGYKLKDYVIIENINIDPDDWFKDHLHIVDDTYGLSFNDIEPIVRKFDPEYEAPVLII